MVNYNNGKVYKIITNDPEAPCYVGSITKRYLSQRFDTHNSCYNRWTKDNSIHMTMSYRLFEEYGVENCKIVLLELCASNSKDELRMREQHYIDTLDCVNKRNAYTSAENKKQNNRKFMKKYAATHKSEKSQYDTSPEAKHLAKKRRQVNADRHSCDKCDFSSYSLPKLRMHKNTTKHKTNLMKAISLWLSEHSSKEHKTQ